MPHTDMNERVAVLESKVDTLEQAQVRIIDKLDSLSKLVAIGTGIIMTLQVVLKVIPIKLP